jgi:hypothetical protein
LQNGVLAMSFGRPGLKVAFSFDGTGNNWDRIVEIVPPNVQTTAMSSIVPISHDDLLLAYDIYGYNPNGKTSPRNTVLACRIQVISDREK